MEYQEIVDGLASRFKDMIGTSNLHKDQGFLANYPVIWAIQTYSIQFLKLTEGGQTVGYFEMPDSRAAELISLSSDEPDVYDLCVQMVSTNVLAGARLPVPIRHFAVNALQGKIKRPTPPHRSRSDNFILTVIIFQLLTTAIQVYKLKMTRNDEPALHKPPVQSACDAVSDALSSCGIEYSFAQLKAYCVSSRKSALRREVKAYLYSEFGDEGRFLNGKTTPDDRYQHSQP